MRNLFIVLISITLMIVMGCAERNDPVIPEQKPQFRVLGISQTPGLAQDIFVSGDLAYVADDRMGISIFNATDLSAFTLIDRISTLERAEQVCYAPMSGIILSIEGDWIIGYQPTDTTAIRVFENQELGVMDIDCYQNAPDTVIIGIADPGESFIIYKTYTDSFITPYWEAQDYFKKINGSYHGIQMDVEDGYVYLAVDQRGFSIAELSLSPFTCSILSEIETPGVGYDVALNGAKTHALLADFQGGVQIIDISDKSNPVIVGNVLPSGVDKVERISCAGNVVFFTDKYNGVFAADISDPTAPVELAHYESNDPMELFAIDDQTVLLADELIGIIALKLEIPTN